MIRLILETISKIITKLILGKSFKRYNSKGGNILKGQDTEMVHSIYIHFNSGLDQAFYLIPIFPNMAAIFMELELAIPSTRGSPLPFPFNIPHCLKTLLDNITEHYNNCEKIRGPTKNSRFLYVIIFKEDSVLRNPT